MLCANTEGYILSWREMLESESYRIRFSMALDLVNLIHYPKKLIHDDACHVMQIVWSTLRDLNKDDISRARLLQLRWVFDWLHSRNDTVKFCIENALPSLPHIRKDIQGVNT